MLLSEAIKGFLLSLSADGYSKATIAGYKISLARVNKHLGEITLEEILPSQLTEYMAWLRNDYKPNRANGDTSPLGGSALQNDWKAIRSFFNWASETLRLPTRPDANLKLPKYMPEEIIPFSESEVASLLKSAEYSRISNTEKRKAFRMKRATAIRDVAIIVLLLDTGIRIGELSRLKNSDIDIELGTIYIKPVGKGTKSKARTVYFGKASKRALWKYLSSTSGNTTDNLFNISPNSIRWLFRRLGDRASVTNVHPHRFRHTFAIEYLRNGGDVFSLQRMLGHSSLEMVRHYLSLADTDSRTAHRKASPADKWQL